MSETENNGDTPTTLDETEKLAAIKLAEENRMDPNIIKAMREAPASSALIDAAARAKTPAEMMEQFANLDPAVIPPEMRAAVEQFKEQQEQKKLEDEALLKKAALAAEVGFAAFAAAVTTSNRAEAASNSVAEGKAPTSAEFAKMSATEKEVYFEQILSLNTEQWGNLTHEQRQQNIDNVHTSAVEHTVQSNNRSQEIREEVLRKYGDDAVDKLNDITKGLNLKEEKDREEANRRLQDLQKNSPELASYGQELLDADIKTVNGSAAVMNANNAEASNNNGDMAGSKQETGNSIERQKIRNNTHDFTAATNEVELKQAKAMSHEALNLKAADIKTEEAKASIDAASLTNMQARANALKADSTDAFDMSDMQADTAQPETPRKSMDLTQLERAQQMMTEFDANGQKPANDAEGPKVAATKGPTVSNS
jgi:hypothetical protein